MVGLTYLESPFAFPGPGWRPVASKRSKEEEKEEEEDEEAVIFAQQLTDRSELLATPRSGIL